MLERDNQYQQNINDRTLFEERNQAMMNAYSVGFEERDKAVSEFIGNCVRKLKSISMNIVGLSGKAAR